MNKNKITTTELNKFVSEILQAIKKFEVITRRDELYNEYLEVIRTISNLTSSKIPESIYDDLTHDDYIEYQEINILMTKFNKYYGYEEDHSFYLIENRYYIYYVYLKNYGTNIFNNEVDTITKGLKKLKDYHSKYIDIPK